MLSKIIERAIRNLLFLSFAHTFTQNLYLLLKKNRLVDAQKINKINTLLVMKKRIFLKSFKQILVQNS